jgi:hydrogenase maturation protein HypF
VCWDGTGYGGDGTIWGGEFLEVNSKSFVRIAHLREFPLPGGEVAVRQPRRSALGLLFELKSAYIEEYLAQHFSAAESRMLRQMLSAKVNSPRTSSAGRLFDAVAALVGLRQRVTFEGQAAMALEFCVEGGIDDRYPFRIAGGEPAIIDWAPMVEEILNEAPRQSVGRIAAKFHNTMAEMIVQVAQSAGESEVVLSGGCFQNRYLLERSVRRLRAEGFNPHWPQRIPTNDGGIAVGQVMGALRHLSSSVETTAPSQKEIYVPGHSG